MTTLKPLQPRRWRADEENGVTTPRRVENVPFEDLAPVLEAPDFPGLSTGRPAWIPRLEPGTSR
jgi:hypothetical protein